MRRTAASLRDHPRGGAASSIRSLVALLLLLGVLSGAAASPSSSARTTTVESSRTADPCPRCPLCSSGRTPLALRTKYCYRVTSLLSYMWRRATAQMGSVGVSAYTPHELPAHTSEAAQDYVLDQLQELLSAYLVGQPHVSNSLVNVVRRKLLFPKDPMVLHLAGDNGVGKTLTARLISKAMSLHCTTDRERCDAGDNLLTLSGTSFDAMPFPEARQNIVRRIMAFMEWHPHGVVLIDDLTAMPPPLVTALAPLLGRGSHFPEQFEGKRAGEAVPSLAQLLVIVTTDLGQQGRTVGRTVPDIEQLVRDMFTHLYGTLVSAHTRTYAYLPFVTATAADVIRTAVTHLPCVSPLVTVATIDDIAASFLVERHRRVWDGKEYGHALTRVVEDELWSQVLVYQSARGADTRLVARFVLEEVNGEGRVVLRMEDAKGDVWEDM